MRESLLVMLKKKHSCLFNSKSYSIENNAAEMCDVREVPVNDGAIAAVHGALGVDGCGQEAVCAAAAGMCELRGGQRGQDAGSSGSSGARWDEAMVSAL